jgi:hypothetical protein
VLFVLLELHEVGTEIRLPDDGYPVDL